MVADRDAAPGAARTAWKSLLRCYSRRMPGNIGWQGLIVILIVLLIIFGPKRLPELGRSLGRGLREFKSSVSGGDDDDDERPVPTEHEIGRLPSPTAPPPPSEPEQPREPQRDTVV